ncbi:hypothetical protein FN846DRAFT_896720 [Sphaerosporella brunnea]|uniref:Uncharacterized protein n=1 Tax=Sphaerosporella brunnea TaxID=1250544 RepID=A0A5J5EB28_9PEZI|nr:hypothetical protein FN846DRAFT_896720 [Sphaerosporella brunnea]
MSRLSRERRDISRPHDSRETETIVENSRLMCITEGVGLAPAEARFLAANPLHQSWDAVQQDIQAFLGEDYSQVAQLMACFNTRLDKANKYVERTNVVRLDVAGDRVPQQQRGRGRLTCLWNRCRGVVYKGKLETAIDELGLMSVVLAKELE